MTQPIAPPPAPTVPQYPALGSANFNSEAYTYATAMPGVSFALGQIAQNVAQNAQISHDNAQESAQYVALAQQTAIGASNFKGAWASLTGPLNPPATVLHANAYWLLLEPLANVTAAVPGVSPAWAPMRQDARPLTAGATLDGLFASGTYSVQGPAGAPAGVSGLVVVEVIRAGDNVVQVLNVMASRRTWRRHVTGISGTAAYGQWFLMSEDNPEPIAAPGGAMDCSKGVYFTTTIAGNTNLTLTNVPSGAYAPVLEVYHTAGAINLPAGAVWASGTPPTLLTPRRHLYYFQRSLTGAGGWIVSALPNAPI